MDRSHDLIVIGGGPAGLTAAALAAHAGLKTILIEQAGFGGQIAAAEMVENWPGDIKVPGAELARRLREQALKHGVRLVEDEVTQASLVDPVKRVITRAHGLFEAPAVILCPGAERRDGDKVPRTDFLKGSGVILEQDGSIVADPDTMATSLEGVFAAGDARRKWLRKLATAAGDGAVAAYAAVEYLQK